MRAVKRRGKNHICPMSANVKASAEEARKIKHAFLKPELCASVAPGACEMLRADKVSHRHSPGPFVPKASSRGLFTARANTLSSLSA